MNKKALYNILMNNVFCIEPSIAQNYLTLIKQNNFLGNNDVFECESIYYLSTESNTLTKNKTTEKNIAIIPITGVIMKSDGMCGQLGTVTMTNQILDCQNDSNCQGIVFMVDSGGGMVTGTEIMANAIKKCSLPTVAVVDGMCASAAYWLASQTDYIYTNAKTNFVGSIGVLVTMSKDSEEIIVTSSKSPDKVKGYTDAIEGNFDTIRAEQLDPIANFFISSVKKARKDVNESVFTGKVYMSDESIRLGLVDAYGDINEAINYILTLNK